MIYEIYVDGKLLYYPDDDKCIVNNAILDQKMNEAGTLKLDVPANNPLYNSLYERQSEIQVLKDGKEIFYGEIREVTTKIKFYKSIYAVGELAYLFDSIQPQKEYRGVSPLEMFTQVLKIHNDQVDDRKKFSLGMVTVTDPNNSIRRFTNREDTLTVFRDKLCDSLNGYLRIRKADGKRYLDLVKLRDYGKVCEQNIEFGDNILQYSAEASGENIATAVIPLGERLEDQVVAGLDAYLTIEKSTKKPATGITHDAGSDFVYNPKAVSKFGMIKVVKQWQDVTIADNLLEKAAEWLNSVQYSELTIELNALDLAALNVNDYDSFELGDTVYAIASELGMEKTAFNIMKKKTYLQDFSKNYISLGNTVKSSYTKQASKAVQSIEDQIPEESEVLANARENAKKILEGAEGGVVLHDFDEKGRMINIMILDNVDPDKANYRWLWNTGGLGCQVKNTKTGEWNAPEVAMTKDGHIVANAITSGYMAADMIKGGILDIGGKEYYNTTTKNPAFNGIIRVRDEKGTEILRIDKNGIDMRGGKTIAWSDIDTDTANKKITEYMSGLTIEKDGKSLFKTAIGDSWIQTTVAKAKYLITTLLYKDSNNFINFGDRYRDNLKGVDLNDRIHIKSGSDMFIVDSIGRTSAKRFISAEDGNPDNTSKRIEYTSSGLGIVSGGTVYKIDAKELYDLILKNTPTGAKMIESLYAWAKSQGWNPN